MKDDIRLDYTKEEFSKLSEETQIQVINKLTEIMDNLDNIKEFKYQWEVE